MHDVDGEHDHALEWIAPDDGDDIEGIERFTLRSVGIDIGSSTMHIIFSKLTLRRQGAGLSAKFVVAGREVTYRSSIMLTPYISPTRIDSAGVVTFVEDAYRQATLTPEDVDSGAVVITGEALKKENARPILEYFAEKGGRFICASAGPMHEALLAAHGSGSVEVSRSHSNAVLNIDIGGGTTKMSLIRAGEIERMLAFEIGARLIAFDDDMRLVRLERPAETVIAELGGTLAVGDQLTDHQCRDIAARMAAVIFDIAEGRMADPLSERLLLTEGFQGITPRAVDHVIFSGGVSEYVYAPDAPGFGDLGPWLGAAIRARMGDAFAPGSVIRPVEGIRATVIGAGEYTLQASGSTSYIGDPSALPAPGLQVAHAAIDKMDSPDRIGAALSVALGKYDMASLEGGIALALSTSGQPDYPFIRRMADAIALLVAPASPSAVLFILVDSDIAKSLGAVLAEEIMIPTRVVVVDGIEVGDLDYVDIGRAMGGTEVIPVTVKSLVFGGRSKSG
ncbi:MAG: ethanolamine ammonia-lyase reactivating factor EutA [Alphaproteobacteria bacterium]|nr:ethanolamine ammonia-lyase reactivating factor EutA [Alphaproteobacteria bacterium]